MIATARRLILERGLSLSLSQRHTLPFSAILSHGIIQNSLLLSQRKFHASSLRQKEDFYKVLGVTKGASKTDIKKKYFELAKKYHPDVNKAPEAEGKFREISEAYEVLENDEKRSMYDKFGHAGVDPQNAGFGGGGFEGFEGFGPFAGGFQGQGGQQVDPQEIFEMFEGMFGGEGAKGKGRDVQQTLHLSFFEAVNGCFKEVTVQYSDRKNPGKVNTKKVKVTVPAGVDDGVVMRVAGEGGAGMAGKSSGDLRLNIKVSKDAYFIREGANIHVEQPISITQAILGSKVDVLTLGGILEVKIPPGTQPDAKLVLRGKGVKDVNSIHKGDQYIHLKIVIPKNITNKQKELLLEFEKEGNGTTTQSTTGTSEGKSTMSSTLESAWNRLKDFMGKKDEENKKKET